MKKNIETKNIVQISSYYPPHLGGLEVVCREVSLELARKGYPVTVYTSTIDSKNSSDDKSLENYQLRRLNSFEIAHTPILFSLLPRLLLLPKRSILHLHIAQAFVPEMVVLAAMIRRFPLVIHFHLDIGPSGSFGWMLPFYKKYIFSRILRRADKVIVFSDEQANLLEKKYKVKKTNIAIIPNGVADEFFDSSERMFSGEKLQLLFVGRLSVQKRLDRLVSSIALLQFPVELTIVGEGEERNNIENLIRKLNLTNVKLVGSKQGDELRAYYKNADAFVISSDIEGMPLVVLEAMAAGLPIVASNVLGLRELVWGTGLLVDEPSQETFAKAIATLQNNPVLLRELSQKSLTKASEFSWRKLVSRLEILYREVSEGRG